MTTSALGVGDHALRVEYGGDADFAPSTAALHQTVGRATTETSVCSSGPSALGAPVTFEATARSGAPGLPTGLVTFRDGVGRLGMAELDAGGTARLTVALGWGSHAVSAIYAGDDTFAPRLSTMTHTVQAGTTTMLSTSEADDGSDDFGEAT